MQNRNLNVLIAEDDENDAMLIARAVKRLNPDAHVTIVDNGKQTVEYLQAKGSFTDRQKFPFPNVLITDLKMPEMNGFELLEWLAQHSQCRVIPTIILSASDLQPDVKKAYELGVNAYFRKPADYLHLVKLLDMNLNFWLDAQLPIVDPDFHCGDEPSP